MSTLASALTSLPQFGFGLHVAQPVKDVLSLGGTATVLTPSIQGAIGVDDVVELSSEVMAWKDAYDTLKSEPEQTDQPPVKGAQVSSQVKPIADKMEEVVRIGGKAANIASDLGSTGSALASQLDNFTAPTQMGIAAIKGLGLAGAIVTTAIDAKQFVMLSHEMITAYNLREKAEGPFEREYYDAQFKTACERLFYTSMACLADGAEVASSWVPVIGLAANVASAGISLGRVAGEKRAFNAQKKKLKSLLHQYETVFKGQENSCKDKYLATKDEYEKVHSEFLHTKKAFIDARKVQQDRAKDGWQNTDLDLHIEDLGKKMDKLEKLEEELLKKYEALKKEHTIIQAAKKRVFDLDPLQQKASALTQMKEAYEKQHPELLKNDGCLNVAEVNKLKRKYEAQLMKGKHMYWDAFHADPRHRDDDVRILFHMFAGQHYNKRDKNSHRYRDAELTCRSAESSLKRLDHYLLSREKFDKVKDKQYKSALDELSKKASKKQAPVRQPLIDQDAIEEERAPVYFHPVSQVKSQVTAHPFNPYLDPHLGWASDDEEPPSYSESSQPVQASVAPETAKTEETEQSGVKSEISESPRSQERHDEPTVDLPVLFDELRFTDMDTSQRLQSPELFSIIPMQEGIKVSS